VIRGNVRTHEIRGWQRAAAAAFGVLLAAFAAQGRANESIFKNALRYTVQIRATVPIPFYGDRKGSGLGAGFLVDPGRGWIMTNAHVVSRSPSRVEVAFYGQEFAAATKVYVDPFLDVAILKADEQIDTRAIEVPPLECDALPRVGHPVGAFGHPWRLLFTGTRGIISGVTARYSTELLQTDAPINQGNSGGPLISLETGRIVGINTAGIAGAQNTNFAVATKYACRILQLLQRGEDPSPPDLKLVYFRDVDDRKELRVARSYASDGLLKLMPGDLIKGVVGSPDAIENETRLLHALRGTKDHSSLSVLRGGEALIVSGRRGAFPKVLERRGVYVSGVLFAPVTIRDAAEIGAAGLMVHHVEAGSAGQSQEIRPSDLLEALDGVRVDDIDQLFERLAQVRDAGRRATFTFRRIISGEALFSYMQRRLPVTELRLIGPPPGRASPE
jgi:S1-C subfamily serine protease